MPESGEHGQCALQALCADGPMERAAVINGGGGMLGTIPLRMGVNGQASPAHAATDVHATRSSAGCRVESTVSPPGSVRYPDECL